jgi:hypothetical protein
MKTKQTSPIPTTIDELESVRTHGRNSRESLFEFHFLFYIR